MNKRQSQILLVSSLLIVGIGMQGFRGGVFSAEADAASQEGRDAAIRIGELQPLVPSAMLPGYCMAGSREDPAASGYGVSANVPKTLGRVTSGNDSSVSLVVLPSETVPFQQKYRGFRLLLINRTKSEAAFQASDSRLPIICEAYDHGKWRPIEFLPRSFCGNSDHHVFLPAGKYWEFAAPAYAGPIKTKLRYKLESQEPMYSNEFEGGVATGQFITPRQPR